MRGLRSTIALLVVALGLGAYIYFVTWKGDGNTAASSEKKVFQSIESSDIAELTIKAESGDRTTVKKEGERWQIVSPIQTPAAEAEPSLSSDHRPRRTVGSRPCNKRHD